MPITIPVTFVDGNYLYASQLNSCFAALAVAYDASGDTMTGNVDMGLFQLIEAKVEVLAVDPAAGNEGRVWFNSVSNTLKFDDGAAVYELVDSTHGMVGPTVIATDPDEADLTEGEFWYNSTSDVLKIATADTSTAGVKTLSDTTHVHADYVNGARNDFRLVISSTALTLEPMNGVQININGTIRAATGLPVIAQSKLLSDDTGTTGNSTLYYVYAYWGTDLELEASVTAPAAKDASGRVNMTGNAAKRLVGMAYTDGSGYWVDAATTRYVASYNHRRPRSLTAAFSTARAVPNTTVAEINSEIQVKYLSWSDDAVQFNFAGSLAHGGATPTGATIGFGIDSTSAATAAVADHIVAGTSGVCAAAYAAEVAVGYHYVTIVGADTTASGVITLVGSLSAVTRI